jgi:hypothetical protein
VTADEDGIVDDTQLYDDLYMARQHIINLKSTAAFLATAMDHMAENPKGGRMAAIAYKHCARLIRERLT